MVYSATPPATTTPAPAPDTITPAPWVPYTRAGCNVGEVATANMELENTSVDIPKVFGAGSPEDAQLINDPDSFKDPETADYVGLASTAPGSAVCANAKAVKYGQTHGQPHGSRGPAPRRARRLQGLPGAVRARYVDPVLGAGTPNLSRNGYQVTNAAGNLVDLNGNEIDGAFLNNHPGFPGSADQRLPDPGLHGRHARVRRPGGLRLHGRPARQRGHPGPVDGVQSAPDALGSGSPCYIAQAQYYNAAFGTFFQRLAEDGITPKNTLFVFSSDEGDHEAGANVGRAPAHAGGLRRGHCERGHGHPRRVLQLHHEQLRRARRQHHRPAGHRVDNTTPFTIEPDTAPEFYVTGNPAAGAPPVRSSSTRWRPLRQQPLLGEHPGDHELLADPTEEAILHMVNADPARTPTFAMFAKPDYFLSAGSATCSGTCVPRPPVRL